MTPKRIHRQRTKGWRMPEGAVYVGRPTVFGNPFRPSPADRRTEARLSFRYRMALAARRAASFEDWLLRPNGGFAQWFGSESDTRRERLLAALPSLRGRDLACWCPLDQPCHADVLLELANR